ncbi:F0F1 ATP synthase subunit delta [Candidatus Nomurabacteria bacterium]|nr:F0F1 ATP synthase subunit delta [Candidatus Nomurabacteria bacterium]
MATGTFNDIARTIYLLSKDKSGASLSSVLHNVVKFLARKRLLSKSESILLSLKKIIDHESGVVTAKVTSPDKLNEEVKKHLRHSLKERYQAHEVHLVETQDKKLLGGVKIEVNDEIIDLSLKNKISKLQEYLTRPV